mgnify:CR=1 FL=1
METPAVPPSEELGFRVTLRTRWSDEDVQGVVNNSVYMTLLEEGRHAYFSARGFLEGGQFPFLLAQTNIAYLSPGRGGQDVRLEMATTHAGRTSFIQAYRVRGADGTVWCEAEARLVLVDKDGKKREMPAEFRAALTPQ